MPAISKVDPKTVELLPEKRELLREPYVDALRELAETKESVLFRPTDGETLRKVRVNLTRAANDLDMKIVSRETRDGALVVYLKPETGRGKGKNKAEVTPQDNDEANPD